MTQKPLVILAVDEDRANQAVVAPIFNQQGITYRFVTERKKFSGGLKQLNPDLIMLFGEPSSDFVLQLLDTLNLDVSFSTRPVAIVCDDRSADAWVKGFRGGVVALFPKPFTPALVGQVAALWAELPSRPGFLAGSGDGRTLAALVDHVRRTRRSGVLVTSPRTPNEGRATFVNGKLERAKFLGAQGVEAVRAMAQLPQVHYTFAEVAGRQGDGAGVVIEVGDITGDEPLIADGIVVGAELAAEKHAFEVEAPPEPAPVAPPPAPSSSLPKLLMVDDDPTILKMFGTLFTKYGFEVTTAKDGEEGALLATQKHFDLVFADLNMPYLDGWGLLRVLRDDFRTRELPVAFISAHDDYRESLRALDAGAQAYVSKGTRLDAIVAQAKRLLEPRAAVAANLNLAGPVAIQIHSVGPQWLLHQLAARHALGTLSAHDGWAAYTLVFDNGRVAHASAVAGKYTAEGERAFNAFVATRAAEGEFTPGTYSPKAPNLFLSTEVLIERACATLNENERRLREQLMVQATHLEVNDALYHVYRQVGPKQWLECARLICEEKLTPRDIITSHDISPVDIEETMKDLLRRGVVTLKKA